RDRRVEGAFLVPLLSGEEELERLLALAESLVRQPPRELIIAWLVTDESDVQQVAARLNERRADLDGVVRTAAFTTDDPAGEVIRLATTYDVALTLLDAPPDLDQRDVPQPLSEILERCGADRVYVPFGGGEPDWAALGVGAWLGAARGLGLRLVGTKSDPRHGQRDAGRLLADGAMAIQRRRGGEGGGAVGARREERAPASPGRSASSSYLLQSAPRSTKPYSAWKSLQPTLGE